MEDKGTSKEGKKGFFSKMVDKLDEAMRRKAEKPCSCCNKDKTGQK
ncbi:MAG: hypothetical protein PHW98_07800 [Candidatus Omnitrophica bacterium]|nr:hypothetical protein [Candidatus Omnitrophota bacterium]MDD5116936.1 hypothetical protein [Candidatus Omnitrophota bacterium]MDD5501368.1 hypothetical protein [Candidatus Omnitrophota bacterium]